MGGLHHQGIRALALLLFAPAISAATPSAVQQSRTYATLEPGSGDPQPGLLGRAARLEVTDVALTDALLRLGFTSGVSIAFSPTRIPADRRVDCECRETTVGEALSTMLEGLPFRFQEIGDQVIVEPGAAVRPGAGSAGQGVPAGGARPGLAEALAAPALEVLEATLTGRVTEAGTARVLVGAQVFVVESGLGTLTDANGRYLIPGVPAGEYELRVQMLGYSEQRQRVVVPADGTVVTDFELSQQAIALDEILVTGTAGRKERRAQGATIADVSVEQVTQVTPVESVTEILQGRIAGVSITQGSGVAGSGQQIRIRGASSISLSNEPLVYIDGIRIDTKQSAVASGAVVNPLNDLNPDEIASVEVVKGPAAATLYGADASAGVIQIITKRGTAGAPFSQTVSLGFSRLDPGFTPYANFAVCRQEDIDAGAALCQGRVAGDVVSDRPLERYGLPGNGSQLSLAWSARGGGERYGFFSSVGVDHEDGLFPNSRYQRISGRLNYNILPAEGLRLEFNFPVLRVSGDFPVTAGSSRGWTTGGMAGSPLTVGTTTDGWFASNRTPEAISKVEHTLGSIRLIPDVKVNWDLSDRFTNRLTVGADVSLTETSQFFPKNDQGWYSDSENQGQIQEDRRKFLRFTMNYLGTVDLPLSDAWGSSLSFGSEIQLEEEDLTYAFGNSLTTNAARSVSAAAKISGGQEVVQDRRVGIYGQWEPNFRERIYLQFGIRADRFAAFGSDAPWFLSPSARISYVLSDEAFWNVGWIPSFRLRAAFGTTGRAPQAGVALRTYAAAPALTGPGQVTSGIIPLNPGNTKLEAERGQEFEVGFDAALFQQRLGLEVTFFNKVTKNLLLRVPQPPSVGYVENPFQNIGQVLNRGVEIGATAQLLAREDLAWDVRLAMSTLKNEVTDLGGVAPFSTIRFGPVNRVAAGRQVGAYHTHRIRSIDLEAGHAVVSDTLEYVGNLFPTLEGSIASTLTLFGNLRLYGHVGFKRDFMLYNATALYRERNFGVGELWVRRSEVLSEEERIRRFGPYVTESGEPIGAGSVLGEYLEPADFIRLDEVSLIYEIPGSVAEDILHASAASVTLSAGNLAIWTDYSGFDPDVQNEFDAIAGRADFFTLPPPRRVGFRVNLTF